MIPFLKSPQKLEYVGKATIKEKRNAIYGMRGKVKKKWYRGKKVEE